MSAAIAIYIAAASILGLFLATQWKIIGANEHDGAPAAPALGAEPASAGAPS